MPKALTPEGIREIRKSRNLTPNEFAALPGLIGTRAGMTVHAWELGKRVPSEEVMKLMNEIVRGDGRHQKQN
jgi:DNA-binding transcriptional regulator YiaG